MTIRRPSCKELRNKKPFLSSCNIVQHSTCKQEDQAINSCLHVAFYKKCHHQFGETATNFSGISHRSLIGRTLRTALRLLPSGTTVPILQGPLRWKRWIVGSSNHGCWLGSYEYEKQKAFQKATLPGHVVYDIGANVGFYSLLASVLVGEYGHVYSFEPLPQNIRYLRRHIEMNKIKNCDIIEAAVSSVDGHHQFDPSTNPCTARLSKHGNITVRTVALDTLVSRKEIRPPSLIKIDIEGTEFEALQGSTETIKIFRPAIFLATHGERIHKACLGLLQKYDYRMGSLNRNPIESSNELIALPNENETSTPKL